MRQVTHGPNDDSGPRWSPDGQTLTFLSDRGTAGSAQVYALERGELGEARLLAEAPGIVEHHEWSPDGSRILLLVAGHGAEQTDALGSGTLGPEAELPDWIPLVESSEGEGDRGRALYVLEPASGALLAASPAELNVWEATWCGDRAVVAIVSEGAGEGAWYSAELALIDPAARSARTLRRSEVQLGWACGSPGGTHAAVIEAVCSDRVIVAGELLLVDPPRERREASTRTAWTSPGRPGATTSACSRSACAGSSRSRWKSAQPTRVRGRSGSDREPAARASTPRARRSGPGRRSSRSCRPGTAHPPSCSSTETASARWPISAHAGTTARRELIGDRRRLRWNAPDGLEIEGFLTLPQRRAALPHDPARPRRSDRGLRDSPAARRPSRADRARLRDLRAQRARIDRPRPRIRRARRGRHGRRRRRRHALGPRPPRRDGPRRSRAASASWA